MELLAIALSLSMIVLLVLAVSLISLLVSLFPALFFLLYVRVEAKRRAAVQRQLAKSNADQIGLEQWFPVLYSSAIHFKTLWKLLPWEATGILLITNKQIDFFYSDLFGTNRAVHFQRGEAKLVWHGSEFWPNGITKWFVLEREGQKHYFMVDTGILVIQSRTKTEELYNQLRPLLA
jgi:hypothetical protein